MDLFDKCEKFTLVRELMESGYYPYFAKIESIQKPIVRVNGKRMIMVGSNNYLGLAGDPRLKKASQRAIARFGNSCTGSRFLNGTLTIHEELEEKLARFYRKDRALLFTTGVLSNLGTISALVGKNDVVITDKYDHASILDGCRLSYGETKRFRHNDMEDLERVLGGIPDTKGKLIVVDGVFSMEGDICRLPDIVRLARACGARLMVDDAHALGVLGAGGRGTGEHFGLEGSIDIVMSTGSKSLGAVGGIIAGSEQVIHYLRHNARALIFSASLPPPLVAAISEALDIIEQEPERRKQLWDNTNKMKKGFTGMGYDTGTSETPIIPLLVGDDMKAFIMWRKLFDRGVFATPVVSPATPVGRALIRTSYMATHTFSQLDRVLEIFEQVGRELGIIAWRRPKGKPVRRRTRIWRASGRRMKIGFRRNISRWMNIIYRFRQ